MESLLDSVCRARPLLGTLVEITAVGGESHQTERAVESAFDAIGRVHRLMSYHESESDVSRLNRANGGTPIVIHEWTYHVLQTALNLQRQSGGLFNIAVAPALETLGLLPSAGERNPLAIDRIPQRAIELLSGNRARLQSAGWRVDLGGIAKGFAVDQAIGVLLEHGVLGGLVNAGGDLRSFGPDQHLVAIRDPREPARMIARTAIRNAALASSGLAFDPAASDRASHCTIIDPRAEELAVAANGATVRAPSCTIADALTKVVMIAGRAASGVLDSYGASALLVLTNGEILATADWQDIHSLAA